jgi:M3 family oligoendopeptidase
MEKFSDLKYKRPDFQSQKDKLLQLQKIMLESQSYEEIRNAWLEMKDSMYRFDFFEVFVYIKYTCGIDMEIYRPEVEILNPEIPKLDALQNECNQILLHSSFISEFQEEFGPQIVKVMRSPQIQSNGEAKELQAEEDHLNLEYLHLLALRGRTLEMNDQYYGILDRLIKIRTEIASQLGYSSYVDMAYKKNLRFDYGEKDLLIFRKQINQLFTPVCDEFHHSNAILDVNTLFDTEPELIHAIQEMFSDISKESGNYIKDIIENGYYDLANRPEKRSDNFSCSMLAHIKMPFAMGVYSNRSYDALMFIHELAHGYAFYTAARTQKLYDYHRSTSSINEIHSKTMEHFAYPYLERVVGNQKKDSIRYHLYRTFDNLPYRCAIDEFEHAIYKDIDMSRKKRCELWADIVHNYMPWVAINPDEIKHGTFWPNQSHLFTHPFYYIEYDVAQMSVFEFYERSKHNYQASWNDYNHLCHNGGSKGYLELLKESNLLNPFSEDNVTKICKPILEEFYSL